jgi:hypothetical protein
MQPNNDLLLRSLRVFFNEPSNANAFLDVLQARNGNPSLRLFDWFVTNWVKHRTVFHSIDSKGVRRVMNLSTSYRSQLKSFNKRRFDPFCRRDRIVFPIRDTRAAPSVPSSVVRDGVETRKIRGGESRGLHEPKEAELTEPVGDDEVVHQLVTTVGQINFFRWCITNDVLAYARQHKDEIDSDMVASAKSREMRVKAKSVACRARGATSSPRFVHCRIGPLTLSFR